MVNTNLTGGQKNDVIAGSHGIFLYFRNSKNYRILNEKLQGTFEECHDVYI